jgi:uncharacterized protein
MKLQPDLPDLQSISASGPGWIVVNGEKIERSVVLGSRGERVDWAAPDFAGLASEHFTLLATLKPELVIFGSGNRLRFPPPQWLEPLMIGRIGLETMDTAAACRTYNILAGEGRHVVAALLLESPA